MGILGFTLPRGWIQKCNARHSATCKVSPGLYRGIDRRPARIATSRTIEDCGPLIRPLSYFHSTSKVGLFVVHTLCQASPLPLCRPARGKVPSRVYFARRNNKRNSFKIHEPRFSIKGCHALERLNDAGTKGARNLKFRM